MNYLETKKNQQEISTFFIIIISLLGIFLNQSHLILGINLSIADFFCCIAILILIYKNWLFIPIPHLMFFFIVTITVIATAVFYVPSKFSYSLDTHKIISDYVKLIAIFVYFLVGYNIANLKLTDKTIQFFAFFALSIAIVGVIFTIFNVDIFLKMYFYGSSRLQGLMNDPNYFSIIQLAAVVYFARTKKMNTLLRNGALLCLIVSVLASGSKTGLITFLCYLFFRVVEHLFKSKKKINTILVHLFSAIILIATISFVLSIFQNLINYLATVIPAFARVQIIFTDFDSALSSGGSGRDTTWGVALEIIKLSPIIGIGVGTYSGVANQLFGTGVLAHNTYLQLFAEWGIPLAIVLFSYIFYLISKVTFSRNINSEMIFILRDILIIFLIGSLAISLNNARMFWLVLGMFNKSCFTKIYYR